MCRVASFFIRIFLVRSKGQLEKVIIAAPHPETVCHARGYSTSYFQAFDTAINLAAVLVNISGQVRPTFIADMTQSRAVDRPVWYRDTLVSLLLSMYSFEARSNTVIPFTQFPHRLLCWTARTTDIPANRLDEPELRRSLELTESESIVTALHRQLRSKALAKNASLGFPALAKGRETHTANGFLNLVRGRDKEAAKGFPTLAKARETQAANDFPNLVRGRETQASLGHPGLAKGRETQASLGHPNLAKGRETKKSNHTAVPKRWKTITRPPGPDDPNAVERYCGHCGGDVSLDTTPRFHPDDKRYIVRDTTSKAPNGLFNRECQKEDKCRTAGLAKPLPKSSIPFICWTRHQIKLSKGKRAQEVSC